MAVTAVHRLNSHTSHNGPAPDAPPPHSYPPNPYANGDVVGSTTSLDRPHFDWTAPLLGSTPGMGPLGDEPGVDVKSKRDEETYGHLKGKTQVTVIDYTSDPDDKNTRSEFTGDQLTAWLDSEEGRREVDEYGRAKGVRWIHVDGLNWDVIKTITMRYHLHPLAVEDALQAENSRRSKIDFYHTHLYFQIMIQHVHASDETLLAEAADEMSLGRMEEMFENLEAKHAENRKKPFIQRLKSVYKTKKQLDSLPPGVQGVFEPTLTTRPEVMRLASPHHREAYRLTITQLSAKYMIPVRRCVLCGFMLRDGTMITMMRRHIGDALNPIYARLDDSRSLLRRSGDVSMLAQAFLDVSVDLALEVSSAFEAEILNLEASVLVNPSIDTVRHLHILSSQLMRLRRSLTPLLRVTYTIRDQDSQRSAAAAVTSEVRTPGDHWHVHGGHDSSFHSQPGTPNNERAPNYFGLPSAQSPPPGHRVPSPMSDRANNPWVQAGLLSATPTYERANPMPNMPPHQSVVNGPNGKTGQHANGVEAVQAMERKGTTNSLTASMLNSALSPSGGGMDPTAPGFFSSMSKVYVGDVIDHLETCTTSLDQFVATCEHLTDYVFVSVALAESAGTYCANKSQNVLSFQTNGSMERLSIVTVVFLRKFSFDEARVKLIW